MTLKFPEIPFSSFLVATITSHVIYAVPTISVVILFNLMKVDELFCVFTPIILASILMITAFSWLIAKGSNWTNAKPALILTCGFPGRIYGLIFGSLVGSHYFGLGGGLILAILFYLVARATMIPLGNFIASKVAPEV